MTPYRAKAFLKDRGITLTAIVEECGWSKTTWSRFLNARLDPEPEELREDIEGLLRRRGIPVPSSLWVRKALAAPAETNTVEPNGEIFMQGHALGDAARVAFKLFVSPFDPEAMVDPAGGDHLDDLHLPTARKFIELRLVQAFTKAGFVALHGEPGSGKTTLLERAFRVAAEVKPIVRVLPANVERRKLTAMHVSAEIIRQLSEEPVPRTANVRDALAASVLRQRYEQGERVALVIDEAHELPDTTVKDLKRFHEMSDGFARLLAIILVGQTELAQRFELNRNHRLREAIIRCQLVHLPPLKEKGDVRGYMAKRFSWVGASLDDVWEPQAVDALEDRLAVHSQQLPVLIGNLANAAMNVAYRRGNPRVTEDEVIDVWGASPAQLQEWGL